MHVVRGRPSVVEDDRSITPRLADLVADTSEPAIRAWTPPRQVAFGRRDATTDGFARARGLAVERGYTPVERGVGGHAVAYTGETVAFVFVTPDNGDRSGIQARYEHTTELLKRALERLGTQVSRGEPDAAYCPGDHSLQHHGKIAGLAQRVRRNVAIVGGCVTVREVDEHAITDVLVPVYDALGIEFNPASVGSVEGAGGSDDPERVTRSIETTFLGAHSATVVEANDLLS